MSSLIGIAPLLIFIAATTHSLAPPSLMQAITIPTSSTSSSLRLLNLSSVADNVPFVNTTRDRVECISAYGYNMPRPSCEDVWENMPTDSEVLTFGARGQGHFERPLPYRYLSSKFNVLRLGVTVAFLADFPIQSTASVLSRSSTRNHLYTTPHLIRISPWLPKLS